MLVCWEQNELPCSCWVHSRRPRTNQAPPLLFSNCKQWRQYQQAPKMSPVSLGLRHRQWRQSPPAQDSVLPQVHMFAAMSASSPSGRGWSYSPRRHGWIKLALIVQNPSLLPLASAAALRSSHRWISMPCPHWYAAQALSTTRRPEWPLLCSLWGDKRAESCCPWCGASEWRLCSALCGAASSMQGHHWGCGGGYLPDLLPLLSRS